MKRKKETERSPEGRRLYTSLLLAIAALVSVTAATVAWFRIADRTNLNSMNIEITGGADLRFDLDAHGTFEEYVKTLSFPQIAQRILREKGFDMQTVPLQPVTAGDGDGFVWEDGTAVPEECGAYLSFTLHFMASQDMLVHLTSADSSGGTDGTAVTSEQEDLPRAMRIRFTAGTEAYVYDPGMEPGSIRADGGKTFGLAPADEMAADGDNAMFYLTEGEDLPVQVHIWLEGTDENCTDALQGADYAIRLRFIGTDSDNNPLDGGDIQTTTDET